MYLTFSLDSSGCLHIQRLTITLDKYFIRIPMKPKRPPDINSEINSFNVSSFLQVVFALGGVVVTAQNINLILTYKYEVRGSYALNTQE